MTDVVTSRGKLRGIDRGDHHAFLGVPYAESPAGRRRFAPPQPAEPWEGVREAVAIGFAAPQGVHPVPRFAASGAQDEDCLNLNVFTPAVDGRARPVLLWIHGGGFTHGMGGEPLYSGGPLAERGDVVVVTINYRLGALGFLSLADRGGADRGATANAALQDVVAALRWVRDEIGAFGGDAGNVTVFGESAGAAAAGCLLAMPSARGLFHRAILQSGTGRAASPAAAARSTDLLLGELGLDGASIDRLWEIPAQEIVAAQGRAIRAGASFGPVADGSILPEAPLDAVRAGRAAGVPLLIGTNRDEVKLFTVARDRAPVDDYALQRLVCDALPRADDAAVRSLIELYRSSRQKRGLPATNEDIADGVQSDARFRIPAQRVALAQRDCGPDAFLYLFTYASPARRGAMGACHALEMPFVFGTLDAPTQDRFAGTGPGVERLSGAMMDAWLAFARIGDPSSESAGPWPGYDAVTRPTMVFDLETRVESDPFADERAAVEALVG